MLYHLHMPSYILRTFTEYPKIKSHKTKIATIRYTNDCDFYFVLEAGLEPAQPQWPKDFKSFVSTIPPFGLSGVDARENCGKFTT